MDKAFFHIAGLLEKYPIISTLLDIYQNERFKFIPYERKRKTAPRQKYSLKPFHGIEIM